MDQIIVPYEELKQLVIDRLTKAQIQEEHAKTVADVLVHANLRSVDSHGVLRMRQYIERIEAGGMNVNPNINVQFTGPVSAMVDGDNGIGHVVAKKAMETAIETAKEKGVGMVGATNSEHCGALSYFVELAAENDLIGFATTNANSIVAPFGGSEPYFGTNPVAYGFPAASHSSLILDMATSNVAFGKILQARAKKEEIPNHWGLDKEGNPTNNPDDVVVLLPIAGPKGYGLGMIVDIFSGILTGSPFATQVLAHKDAEDMRNLGHFFIAINPDMFVGTNQFKQQIDAMIDELHQQKPAKGFDRVMVPGEPEQLTAQKRRKEGIPLVKSTYDYLIGADQA